MTIHIPASEVAVQTVEYEKEAAVTGSGHRILLMDDEEMILQAVSQMLLYHGYIIAVAHDGVEAIEQFQKAKETGESFDAVILDLTIPGGMVGQETIARLKEIDPQIKAIVSSGYANDPVMAEYEKHGFCGVVTKPYKFQEMLDLLNQVIANNQLPLNLKF